MKISRTSLALTIRASRKQAKLTLEQVAARTNINLSALSRIELGARDMTVVELVELAEVLKVDIQETLDLAMAFEAAGVTEKKRQRDKLSQELESLVRTR